METCLAGETPESISDVLVERSLQLSAAQFSLQSKATELENLKRDFELLQVTYLICIQMCMYILVISCTNSEGFPFHSGSYPLYSLYFLCNADNEDLESLTTVFSICKLSHFHLLQV